MTETSELIMLLKKQLGIYQELRVLLKAILEKRIGSVWGYEQVDKVNDYFYRLNELDSRIKKLVPGLEKIDRSPGLTDMLSELNEIIMNVKDLLSVLRLRIEGGLEQTSGQLKMTVRNLEIKGYQNKARPARHHACGVF